MLLEQGIWIGTAGNEQICLLPENANRHGLISGATGTGKTVTLQVLAEGFSALGVPVFMADVKGDLAGLCKPGIETDKIRARLTTCGAGGFEPHGFPVAFWDVFGKSGHPVRTTVSTMGPLLLGRMLQLNDTQAGVLHLVFRIADDEGLLLIDLKDLRAMLSYVADKAQDYTVRYGNITKVSVGAIQRAIALLEDQGGNLFFGEQALNVEDWLRLDDEGQGMINILAADQLFLRPSLYSAFMLWMLGALYEFLPEQGDSALPRMVFFFDEAHLLFNHCSPTLLEKIELIIRLIRSKGVGVYFITQNPGDIPPSVLGQLSARVQHALRAFTPLEQRAVKAVAQTFRPNPAFDTEETLFSLATGEALVSFLDQSGAPSIVQKTTILPPQSSIGAINETLRVALMDASEMKAAYGYAIDRESAYEVLSERFARNGVNATSVLRRDEGQAAMEQQAPQEGTAPQLSYRVFDPKTGQYVQKEMVIPSPPQPMPMRYPIAEPEQVQRGEIQRQAPVRQAGRTPAAKETKSDAEKMLDRFAQSAVRGAGYTVGRSLSRGILGIFGLK